MGVNCRIHLPDSCRVDVVANVMGALAGLPVTRHPLNSPSHPRAWSAHVEGAVVSNTNTPSMARIMLTATGDRKLFDGEPLHHTFYHFESSWGQHGGRVMLPRSFAFWIAIGRRLVDFFGGVLDYQDCDDSEMDYVGLDKGRKMNSPETGKPWQNLQERIAAIVPITKAEWRACDVFAAYKIEE